MDIEKLVSNNQLALWIALLEYYHGSVYPLKISLSEEGKTVEYKSFPTLLCEKMAGEWTEKLRRIVGDDKETQKLLQSARENLLTWTDIVPESENDLYLYEVNIQEHLPKRVLSKKVMERNWSIDGKGLKEQDNDSTDFLANQEIGITSFFYVALDGKADGPHGHEKLQEMIRKGVLTKETKVWTEGMAQWAEAKEVEELSGLLVQPQPLTPPPLNDGPPPLD